MLPLKKALPLVLGLCLVLSQNRLWAAISGVDSHKTIISNPLVCLVGVSEYDTQKELPSVREEMRELYDLFYFDCGYEVNATFPYDKQYASSHKDLPKMRLSLNDLNQFLKQSYKELYKKADFYDGLIFVFSGHGFSNGHPLIVTSECKFVQSSHNGNKYTYTVVGGCKYFSDVRAQLTKLKKDDPKEKFVSKPKIFFNLSCQNNPEKELRKEEKEDKLEVSIVYPERESLSGNEEEEKFSSISEEKKFKKLREKNVANIITISSALPSFDTGTNTGLRIVKCLRAKFKDSLGQQSDNKSLYAIINHVRKSIRKIPHPSGGLMTDEVFFFSVGSLPNIRSARLRFHSDFYQNIPKDRWISAVYKMEIDKIKKIFNHCRQMGINIDFNEEVLVRGARAPLHRAASKNSPEGAKFLLQNGAYINLKSAWGETPLHKAAKHNNIEVMKLLIAEGADVNAQDDQGRTPLFSAAGYNYSEQVVKVLIEAKADVNKPSKGGSTPLHYAVEYCNKKIVEMLIEAGANKDAKTKDGKTPLGIVTEKDNKAMIKYLESL